MIGKTISHYKILSEIGSGGMGIVYKAEDTNLKRHVALKFLPPELTRDTEARERFIHEAQLASALDHPNICTIHEIGKTDDNQMFIVMAYYEGKTLKKKIEGGSLKTDEILDITMQIAEGLSRAHESEIIHRDIKPANILISKRGEVKILDFGLAKLSGQTKLTKAGSTIGTAAYMSPEQTSGEEVDHGTDIWSLGVLLFEMLTGKLPFKGDYEQAVIYSILNEDPEPLTALRSDAPDGLMELVHRALAKNAGDRYSTMEELIVDLRLLHDPGILSGASPSMGALLRRPRVAFPTVVLLLALGALAVWQYNRSANVRWAQQIALPEIERLAEAGKQIEAFNLAEEAKQYIDDDTALLRLWPRFSAYYSINSNPPNANVFLRGYADVYADWKHIGQTPIDSFRYSGGTTRIKIEKEGYVSIQVARDGIIADFSLVEEGNGSHESVKIPAPNAWYLLPVGLDHLDKEPFNEFLMDAFEVSNSDFKQFIDSGGYTNKAYWKHAFLKDGRIYPWEEAIGLFTDKSRQPGPATWEVQDFPDGQEDYPVTGLSWYEAAAYAEFVGKKLPTLFEWAWASRINWSDRIVPLSNLFSDGPMPRGINQGMSPFGTFDMAGNVREWIFNPSNDPEARYLLGGGWNDPDYGFTDAFAQKAFDRSVTNGFRCITYLEVNENQARLERPLARNFRDYYAEEPVSDREFAGFLRQYAYDKTPLNARIEDSDNSADDWVREKITLDATYGGERVIA